MVPAVRSFRSVITARFLLDGRPGGFPQGSGDPAEVDQQPIVAELLRIPKARFGTFRHGATTASM